MVLDRMQTVTVNLSAAVSTFGADAKAKLSNPSATGEPEDQLRAPLEGLFADLAELCGFRREWVAAVGESSLSELKVRPDFAATQEETCAHVARYPASVLALVVPAWALAAFAGTWIAQRIGGRPTALFVGLLLATAVLFNVSMLPYPIWFKIASVIAVIAAVVATSRSHH